MNIPIDEVQNDTTYVLSHKLPGENISNGHWAIDSPIFDTLAADRFASDVTTFNLGDYR